MVEPRKALEQAGAETSIAPSLLHDAFAVSGPLLDLNLANLVVVEG
jgi:hypothetical protein